MTWQHFAYGLAYLGRAETRRTLETVEAIRIARATDESYRQAMTDLRATVTVPADLEG